MNFFEKIKLENFRNFEEYTINFNNQCNVIIGPNGSGKTNLLESISLFDKGRGFRKDLLKNMINSNSKNNLFLINSVFNTQKNNLDLILSCELNDNKLKKKLLVNGSNSRESIKFFEKLYSIIWFLPEMERLFLGSPSLRRNFLDRLIYGADKNYITLLNHYRKIILERNKILKKINYDENWIYQIENEIVNYGFKIYLKRAKHIEILNSEIKSLKVINKDSHSFKLNINDNFFTNPATNEIDFKSKYLLKLKNLRNYDAIVGGCKIGPHKSDINGIHLEKNLSFALCSTGQQKAIILLIIIAQCKYLINILNRKPIVLLDEVCSHLDKYNREILLELINSLDVQIFVTGTEKNFFSFLSTKASYYTIE